MESVKELGKEFVCFLQLWLMFDNGEIGSDLLRFTNTAKVIVLLSLGRQNQSYRSMHALLNIDLNSLHTWCPV